ncbi:unnamed protein product [Paramecium sonneborni]|uniref:WD-40 repeat protein n=1 Tax=Paramecium sonneborni TaxID=65129 RepID=A0A8S1RUV8_9CILI|nr:unnamed protein product [Paramecium sonneborni]
MLGLKYYTYQYYSYQDLEELKSVLKYDSIGEIKFYDDEKIIEYKINRERCLLLGDLIELIKIGFIRFHLGQLLLLFIQLLEKVKNMESHKIEHKYLSLDRIWLKFNNNQYLTIIYKRIEYEIAFTGYNNKFEEDLDTSIRLWDFKIGQQKAYQMGIHHDCATEASGSEDKSIRLWDLKTGQQKTKLDGHSKTVMSVCFSPDGATLASSSCDYSIRLWDTKSGKSIEPADKRYKDLRAQFNTPLSQNNLLQCDIHSFIIFKPTPSKIF